MASIFTKIISGEIPCYKLAETDEFISFLDVRPQAKGHALALPKKEIDYIFDQDDATLAGLIVFAKKVGLAIEKVVPCERIGIAVIGLEVPHTHVHLIPLNSMKDMRFNNKIDIPAEEMAALAAAISAKIVL
jgi:histidine triad (HIT) family protein